MNLEKRRERRRSDESQVNLMVNLLFRERAMLKIICINSLGGKKGWKVMVMCLNLF